MSVKYRRRRRDTPSTTDETEGELAELQRHHRTVEKLEALLDAQATMSARLAEAVEAAVQSIDREKDRRIHGVTDGERIAAEERAARLAKKRIQDLGTIDLGLVWTSLLDLMEVPVTCEVVAAVLVEPFAALLGTAASAIDDLARRDSMVASLTAELAQIRGRTGKQEDLELADILESEASLLERRLHVVTAARSQIDPIRTRIDELCKQCEVAAVSAQDDVARVRAQESRLMAGTRNDLRERWCADLQALRERGESIHTGVSEIARALKSIKATVDDLARRALLEGARCTDLARSFRQVAEYFRSGKDSAPADVPPTAAIERRVAPLGAAAGDRERAARDFRGEVDDWLSALHVDTEEAPVPGRAAETTAPPSAPPDAPAAPRNRTPQDFVLVALVLLQELGSVPADRTSGRAMTVLVDAATQCGFIAPDDAAAFRDAVAKEARNPIGRIVRYEASPARNERPATLAFRLTSTGAAAAYAQARRLMTSDRRTVLERVKRSSAPLP